MPLIFGVLDIEESQQEWTIKKFGERILFDAATEYLNMHNEDLQRLLAAFVEEETEIFKEVYELAGGGRMQRRGEYGSPAARQTTGKWTVEYPLNDNAEALGMTKVGAGYMTVKRYQKHVEGITIASINTHKFEILRRLMNNASENFEDQHHGTLVVQPLANGDATLYTPIKGDEDPATEDHYLVSGYTSASISDTNNPFPVIRKELEHHFGTPTGFGNVLSMIHPDQTGVVGDLTDFIPVEDIGIKYGDDTDLAAMLGLVPPGRLIGRCNGVWVSESYDMTADYMVSIDLDIEGPLKRRVDPAETDLPRGLTMLPQNEQFPIETAEWWDRWGYGTGNRLNGVVMQFTTGAYTIPTAYQ